jgi:hypothetical protein
VKPTTPELAVLSALSHGADEPEAVRHALLAIRALGEDRAQAYFDLLKYHLGAALDRALEAIMTTSERRYLSDFANDYFDKGKAEGQAEGLQAALVAVLSARGFAVSDAGRAQIASCTDVATLTRWLARAATVPSEADVFAESSKG